MPNKETRLWVCKVLGWRDSELSSTLQKIPSIWELSDQDRSNIIKELKEELQEKGYNDDSKINPYGIQLTNALELIHQHPK